MGWVTHEREPLRHTVGAVAAAIAGRSSRLVNVAVNAFVTAWATHA
jgi:hypothetical protein